MDKKLFHRVETLKIKHPFDHLPGFWKDVYLASVVQRNGARHSCVVLVEKDTEDQSKLLPRCGFLRTWYNFDTEKMIDPSTIVSVAASPHRVTSMEIFGKLEEHGHFDDYTHHAKLRLRNGDEYWIHVGSPGHIYGFFIAVPEGHTAQDIVDVEWPSEGYDSEAIDELCIDAPLFRLCVFKRPPS